jgi:hypothetical protein
MEKYLQLLATEVNPSPLHASTIANAEAIIKVII